MKLTLSVLLGGLLYLMTVSTGCQQPAQDTAELQHYELQQYQYTQLHLGVQVRILVFAEKPATAQNAVRAAFRRIAALEDIFSNYRPSSELNRLLTSSYNKPTQVSDELFQVLEESKLFARETGGAFDVTVGPYIELWRASRDAGHLPNPDTLRQLGARVGSDLIVLQPEGQHVLLAAPNMKIDMGGIAKGYILDEALETLRAHEINRALIEAGGDIVVGAPPPGKAGWSIDVPETQDGNPIATRAAALSNAAIATSGDTEQFVEIDGVRYSHVINPETGLGLTSRRKATVIAPDGITADRFATALTVMDSTAARALLARHPEITAYVRVAHQALPENQDVR